MPRGRIVTMESASMAALLRVRLGPGNVTEFYREVRRGGGGSGSCRLRGGDGGGAHGAEDRPLHHEPRPYRADVVQPGGGRDRQGTLGARSRRVGRRDGRGDRCGRHPVSAAQHQPRAGRLVAARPGGQEAISHQDAPGARSRAQPAHQAGGSSGPGAGRSRGPRLRFRRRPPGDAATGAGRPTA